MLASRVKCICLRALALVFAAGLSAHAEPASPASSRIGATTAGALTIDGLGKGTAPLNGLWQFHLGDNPAWANPALDDTTGQNGWEQLTADKPWGAQSHPGYDGFAWYRRRIRVESVEGEESAIALLVPSIDDAYELYWNGALVGRFGKLPPHPYFFLDQAPQMFGLGRVESGTLAIRVWKAPSDTAALPSWGGSNAAPVLGTTESISRYKASIDYEWMRSHQLVFVLDSLYLFISLLAFLAWLRDQTQSALFWLAAFCMAQPLMVFLMDLRMPFPHAASILIFGPALALKDISLWFLLLRLLQLDELPPIRGWIRRFALTQAILTGCDSINVYVMFTAGAGWARQLEPVDDALTFCYTGLEMLPLFLVACAVIRQKRLNFANWLLALSAFLAAMIFVGSLGAEQGRSFTHINFADRLEAPIFIFYGNAINAEACAQAFLILSLIYALFRYSLEEHRKQARLEQEFRNARELQQILIPQALPSLPGFTLTSAYKPALEVGGDFFQIIPLPDGGSAAGSTLVVLGDVSGKGLKAAMAVSLIVGATRMVAEYSSSPAEILASLNRRLEGRLQGGFATCIAMRLDSDGTCTVSSAGHPAPFLNDNELVLPGALPLGVTAHAAYDETTIRLNPGDRFALYTDGLLEARNPSGELYSFTRLKSLFTSNPTAAQATEAAVAFGQDDDITVLTLTRLGAGESATVSHDGPALATA